MSPPPPPEQNRQVIRVIPRELHQGGRGRVWRGGRARDGVIHVELVGVVHHDPAAVGVVLRQESPARKRLVRHLVQVPRETLRSRTPQSSSSALEPRVEGSRLMVHSALHRVGRPGWITRQMTVSREVVWFPPRLAWVLPRRKICQT